MARVLSINAKDADVEITNVIQRGEMRIKIYPKYGDPRYVEIVGRREDVREFLSEFDHAVHNGELRYDAGKP